MDKELNRQGGCVAQSPVRHTMARRNRKARGSSFICDAEGAVQATSMLSLPHQAPSLPRSTYQMSHSEWLAILDDKHPVVDLAHSLCLPRGELKEKVSSMVAERFQMHSDLKTEAQKMLNSYLAASVLYGEWRWEPAIGLRKTKRFTPR